MNNLTSHLLAVGTLYGVTYSAQNLIRAMMRAKGLLSVDPHHTPQSYSSPPADGLMVDQGYHHIHHFNDPNAAYCGVLKILDQILGTARSLKGKTVAITGANGDLTQALVQELSRYGVKKIILFSSSSTHQSIEAEAENVTTHPWRVGEEWMLQPLLEKTDILIINHGMNAHRNRTVSDFLVSFDVNTHSVLRLAETFFKTVRTNADIANKEVWINTSQVEVQNCGCPSYDVSKKAVGQAISALRLDAPCIVRKLVLGGFKSKMNPKSPKFLMSPQWVAKRILFWSIRDIRNIVVSVNPLVYFMLYAQEFKFARIYQGNNTETQTDNIVFE